MAPVETPRLCLVCFQTAVQCQSVARMRTKYVYDVTVSVPQPAEHFAELRRNYISSLGSASHTDLQLSAQVETGVCLACYISPRTAAWSGSTSVSSSPSVPG